jgi:hypothetical protein
MSTILQPTDGLQVPHRQIGRLPIDLKRYDSSDGLDTIQNLRISRLPLDLPLEIVISAKAKSNTSAIAYRPQILQVTRHPRRVRISSY